MEIDASSLAIITAVLALIGTIITAVFGFRSKLPEAADDVASGFQKILAELRGDLDRVKSEVVVLRDELASERELRKELERGVRILIQQLRDNNIRPKWTIKVEE